MGRPSDYINGERSREFGGETAHLHATDSQLVRRARHNDEAAFHELVDRYAGYLYGLAFSLVGNAADAEDVVQETFSGAFRRLSSFEERATVKTWLCQILIRQAATCRRSRGRRRMVFLGNLSESSQALLWKEGADAPTRPPYVWRASELDVRLDVLETLESLTPDHREVIELREMEGMSYDEIAATLGIPRGTVESRLFRARQELKERLKAYLP
jgi:RNA polymerase sigma-70 factor (ECF subfamily)